MKNTNPQPINENAVICKTCGAVGRHTSDGFVPGCDHSRHRPPSYAPGEHYSLDGVEPERRQYDFVAAPVHGESKCL